MLSTETPSLNGNAPHVGEEARAGEEAQLASNLTLIMPPVIDVDFMEFDATTDANGEQVMVPRLRRAKISTYVPMKIFHRMLAGRSDFMAIAQQTQASTGVDPERTVKMMDWMVDVTFAVWQRSEPNMSLERYESGLQMDQITELFQRFFGASMARFAERSKFMQTMQNQ